MGVYVYTFRKQVTNAKDMDTGAPIQIGVTAFAYRYVWMHESAEYKRTVNRLHNMADRARDAFPNIVLVTEGNPRGHDFDKWGPMAVYRVRPTLTSYADTEAPGEKVGYLYKRGRKYEFERLVEEQKAA